eukprot:COSAG01_NODE_2470_length_7633_cov_17.854468_1_plen_514_part_10
MGRTMGAGMRGHRSIVPMMLIGVLLSSPSSFRGWSAATGVLAAAAAAEVELVAAHAAVVDRVTSKAATVHRVVDGDTATFWQSGACMPSGWLVRPELNGLLGACAAGLCSSSDTRPKAELTPATDGNMAYTNVWISPLQSVSAAWLRIVVPRGPQPLRRLKLRGRFYSNATVTAFGADGTARLIGMMTPHDVYAEKWLDFPAGFVTAELELRVRSEARPEMGGWCYGWTGDCLKFLVSDVAALVGDCHESVSVDLRTPALVSSVWTRLTGQSGMKNVTVHTSVNGTHFSLAAVLGASPPMEATTALMSPMTARFLKISFAMQDSNWKKVSLWELRIFGAPLSMQSNSSLLQCPNQCGHGTCMAPAVGNPGCVCQASWGGHDCLHRLCLQDCGLRGTCASSGSCVCDLGFSNAANGACEAPLCPHDCWGHGNCTGGACICDPGYQGSDCLYATSASGARILDIPMLLAQTPRNVSAAGCPASLPYVCGDGSCAHSMGHCAVRALTAAQHTALPRR